MKLIIRERTMIDKFKCIDTYSQVSVKGLAFKQGELFYFKKNDFEYLVVGYDSREDVYYI